MYGGFPRLSFIMIGLLLLVVLCEAPCNAQRRQSKSNTTAQAATTRTYSNIRQVDFKNFDYGSGENLVHIRRGVGTFNGDRVKGLDIYYGDITGDGPEDGVVVISARGEGLIGLYPVGMYSYTLKNGRPERLPDVDLDEMAGLVTEVRIRNGLLFVNHLINPQPNGRPSQFFSRTWAFRWNGSGFDKVDVLPTVPSGETRYYFRLFNCDDGCSAEARDFVSTEFGKDSGWIDFSEALQDGRNQIKFTVNNEAGGIAYGIRVMKNDSVIFEKICGRAGLTGCENNRVFPRGVAREFTFTIIK
jgi:hypothetical protein